MAMRMQLPATLLATLAAVLGTAATANAQWSEPFAVSESVHSDSVPEVAVAPTGEATVVWASYDGPGGDPIILARRVDANAALGPIQHMTDPAESGIDPDVAVDADGNATVVWTRLDGGDATVRARRITAAGTLEDIQDVSALGEDGNGAEVAVDAEGNAAVVWRRPDNPGHTIRARRIDAAGRLRAIVDVSDGTTTQTSFDVAAGPAGNAFVVWVQSPGSGGGVIEARRIAANGGLGAITDLSASGEPGFDPQVAVYGDGLPIAAWQREDGTIQARRDLGGGLSPIMDLSQPDAHGADVAVDATGIATVVWSRFDGTSDRAQLRRLDPTGALDDFEDLWSGGDDQRPTVTVDGDGDATVIWRNIPGSGDAIIRTRTAPVAGGLGDTLDLTAADEVDAPALATDPSGHSTAVWARHHAAGADIVAARFPAPPPPASPPAVPAPPQTSSVTAPSPGTGSTACPVIGLGPLRASTAAAPKSRRTKGVAARLTLSGPADLEVVSGRLSYKLGGRTQTARLRAGRSTASNVAKLRFALPKAVAAKLRIGTRVTLRLKVRAGQRGCAFGAPRTLRIATRVAWVRR